jgi:AcrR family transcriptional regulator
MDKTTAKKIQIIQRLTGYVIEHGLTDIGLRKLAAVAGASDRMLIYYFETKDALIGEVLHAIASNLAAQLDAVLGQGKRSRDELLGELLALSSTPGFYAVIQLWFEIVGLAARGEQPYAQYATAIAENWLGWIESRLEDDQAEQARSLFAELEGRLLLQIVGIDAVF